MLEIRQFEPDNVLKIVPREPDRSILMSVADPLEYAREYVKRGPCWTLWNGDEPIACAGMIILWPHVAESWALTSESVARFPIAFHKAAKWAIEKAMFDNELFRLQVTIPETHIKSCKWIERLGFKNESTMPMYGTDGSTYIRFVKFCADRREEWVS